jgi:lysophospholipase L1-like esterase
LPTWSIARWPISERRARFALAFYLQLLQRARDRVRTWDGSLIIVYLPSWKPALERPGTSNPLRDSVLARIRALDIPVVDVYPTFQQRGPEHLYSGTRKLPGHLSVEGNAVVARAIAAQLR